jgi:hypothetical protein
MLKNLTLAFIFAIALAAIAHTTTKEVNREQFVYDLLVDNVLPIKQCLIEQRCQIVIDSKAYVFVEFFNCNTPTTCTEINSMSAGFIRNRFRNKIGVTASIFKNKITVPSTGIVIRADGFYENTLIGLMKLY